MTKETKKEEVNTVDLMMSLKSNDTLKTILTSVLKTTNGLENSSLVKIADAIKNVILEYKKITEKQTQTDESVKVIQVKALREHAYSLVNYDRKEGVNSSFETLVTRAIHSAIVAVDYPNEFQIDSKNSTIFVQSKLATPYIVEKLQGQKAGTKKRPNTDTSLVSVHTGIIDRVYRVKYAVPTRARKPKTKDEKAELNFKDISREFKKYLTKSIQYAQKKDVQFFDFIDDSVVNEIKAIKSLLDNGYNIISQFNSQYQVGIDGDEIEKRVVA